MDLVKDALCKKDQYVTRIQSGWQFSPKTHINQEIIVEPFDYQCSQCNSSSIIDSLDTFCGNCYECDVYPYSHDVNTKINTFNVEIIEEKQLEYLDFSKIYKIKVNEFFGTMFCGVLDEPNEWSSTPHDDYWQLTFLFINEQLCDKEYLSLKKLKDYLL